MTPKRSDERHPYLKGWGWWSTQGAFWRDPSRKFSERTKLYYEKWLNDMRVNEKQIKRLA